MIVDVEAVGSSAEGNACFILLNRDAEAVGCSVEGKSALFFIIVMQKLLAALLKENTF